jgi:glyoxylase-like metal-dependent hydrolase (beta-lactamase superfamily II)
VQILHQPAAHTDGDVIVFFRKSDVIVAGDVYMNTTFPIAQTGEGGGFQGVIDALNRIIDLTVPKEKQEGGTFVIPGHGRLADEADIVEYRDMNTIIRDRFQDAIGKGMTLAQIKAARLVRDYEGRYGASTGFWTTDNFVEAVYGSLSQPRATTSQKR